MARLSPRIAPGQGVYSPRGWGISRFCCGGLLVLCVCVCWAPRTAPLHGFCMLGVSQTNPFRLPAIYSYCANSCSIKSLILLHKPVWSLVELYSKSNAIMRRAMATRGASLSLEPLKNCLCRIGLVSFFCCGSLGGLLPSDPSFDRLGHRGFCRNTFLGVICRFRLFACYPSFDGASFFPRN